MGIDMGKIKEDDPVFLTNETIYSCGGRDDGYRIAVNASYCDPKSGTYFRDYKDAMRESISCAYNYDGDSRRDVRREIISRKMAASYLRFGVFYYVIPGFNSIHYFEEIIEAMRFEKDTVIFVSPHFITGNRFMGSDRGIALDSNGLVDIDAHGAIQAHNSKVMWRRWERKKSDLIAIGGGERS